MTLLTMHTVHFFFFWFIGNLTFFFNFIFIYYIDLGLDLVIFFGDLVLGPYSVEKQIQHSVDAWFEKIKLNFVDSKQSRL